VAKNIGWKNARGLQHCERSEFGARITLGVKMECRINENVEVEKKYAEMRSI